MCGTLCPLASVSGGEFMLAYIDPGTGSYIVQVLIASVVGLAYGVKVYWVKIRSLLGRLFQRSKTK